MLGLVSSSLRFFSLVLLVGGSESGFSGILGPVLVVSLSMVEDLVGFLGESFSR